MPKQLSKRAQRLDEKQMMATRVEVALAEARVAAIDVYEAYAATVSRDANGRVIGPWGNTHVHVLIPSYRFRMALIEAGVIDTVFQGKWMMDDRVWPVNGFPRARGRGMICDAVLAVLKRHFPEERINVGG